MSLKNWIQGPLAATAATMAEKVRGSRTIRRTRGAVKASIPNDTLSVDDSTGSISLRVKGKVHKIVTEEAG